MENSITQPFAPLSKAKLKQLDKELKLRKRKSVLTNAALYLMILPGVLYFIIFKYVPMGGIIIAFQDYQPFLGIKGSQWVGMKHFIRLFTEPTFRTLLVNTLYFFVLNIVFFFPLPIVLALLLNEVRHKAFKKIVQTIIYIPHFMSWVIIVSISFVLLSMDGGMINEALTYLGLNKIPFLTSANWAGVVYTAQIIWKELGWSTIIYLAAITAVDTQLYEAADIDGATLLQKMWHVTLPAIRPVIVTLLILKVGNILNLGFEHMYLLVNPLNRERTEIFDTYIYTAGLKNGQLSFSTAMGLFKGVVGFIMVSITNKIANMLGEDGVY
ncbi:sugar ABC transporter permease [Aerococcaceae bacterium zg-ZUI334]|uniref:ABC transporter permease n=1 Tax=Aerococcaceae TaxID=186827 RepID=UPI0013BE7547|nr:MULTISPECIES: ABC transporter permease subunit [unclassified Facklamia]MBR7928022.1 sugar ABC transporter permease [Aerococcaceae bacterium zg-ZUI334]MBS4462916.1 sugar ABC transporter permease [Aerococcaceae bacterium zg-B36]QQD65470.1 sugar ABC transporter permease [Aerococcaceae bacterium zg-252]NEW65072.1 ABC transporter permease subunit [Facklamia sp. 252]NEW68676.1 ABC transporter permease subunit [Facklamia sp. 253]